MCADYPRSIAAASPWLRAAADGRRSRGPARPRRRRPSFAFAIGNGNLTGGPAEVAARLGAFDLVVVDGELATAEEVAACGREGTTVLAYLSVGTIEKWRSWYTSVKRFRLGRLGRLEGRVVRRRLEAAAAPHPRRQIAPEILAKGFDGLFLDNVDMIETRNHALSAPGMRELVLALSDARARRRSACCSPRTAPGACDKLGLLDAIDGWNREDVTWTYDFDRRRYVRNGDRSASRGARTSSPPSPSAA